MIQMIRLLIFASRLSFLITDICIPLVILVLQSLVSCANLLGRVGEESNLANYIHFLQEHLQLQEILYSFITAAAAA